MLFHLKWIIIYENKEIFNIFIKECTLHKYLYFLCVSISLSMFKLGLLTSGASNQGLSCRQIMCIPNNFNILFWDCSNFKKFDFVRVRVDSLISSGLGILCLYVDQIWKKYFSLYIIIFLFYVCFTNFTFCVCELIWVLLKKKLATIVSKKI